MHRTCISCSFALQVSGFSRILRENTSRNSDRLNCCGKRTRLIRVFTKTEEMEYTIRDKKCKIRNRIILQQFSVAQAAGNVSGKVHFFIDCFS